MEQGRDLYSKELKEINRDLYNILLNKLGNRELEESYNDKIEKLMFAYAEGLAKVRKEGFGEYKIYNEDYCIIVEV